MLLLSEFESILFYYRLISHSSIMGSLSGLYHYNACVKSLTSNKAMLTKKDSCSGHLESYSSVHYKRLYSANGSNFIWKIEFRPEPTDTPFSAFVAKSSSPGMSPSTWINSRFLKLCFFFCEDNFTQKPGHNLKRQCTVKWLPLSNTNTQKQRVKTTIKALLCCFGRRTGHVIRDMTSTIASII